MRLVHLADLHLGFRQYQRVAPGGQNQREADVARTFVEAVDRVVALRPDLILVAGDIFHHPRPTNSAILLAFTQFSRLREALPNTPIVVAGGNHDTPRTTDIGGILQLLTPLGVHVADREATRFAFPELELSVLAVPDAGASRPALQADPSARFNVMVLHGEVQGMLPAGRHADRSAIEIPLDDLRLGEWDYVALGHYHVHRRVAANAYYSGSIDYASTNAWGELAEERDAGLAGKGFVERDLRSGAQTFHALSPARPLVDLAAIDVVGLTAPEVDAAIRASLDACPGGIDEKLVRLVVRNVERGITRDLDHRALRELKRRAMHLRLDLRAPVRSRGAARVVPIRTPSLHERVVDHLTNRLLGASDVDRSALLALAGQYLGEAGERRGESTEAA